MRLHAYAMIEEGATHEDIRALEAVFTAGGIEADINPGAANFSQLIPWTLTVQVPLTAFATAVAAAFGQDAYKAVKQFVKRSFEARRTSGLAQGSFHLDDTASRITIKGLDPAMPDEAYRALLELDLSQHPSGFLGWDPERQVWIHDSPDGRFELRPPSNP